MKLLKSGLLIAIFAMLAACASGPKFSKPEPAKEGMAAIYVYRPWTYANGAASPVIQLDGAGEEKLVNGSFLKFETKPGTHKISIAEKFDPMIMRAWPKVDTELAVEPNKEYYVRFSTAGDMLPTGVSMIIRFGFAFQLIPAEIALKEIRK